MKTIRRCAFVTAALTVLVFGAATASAQGLTGTLRSVDGSTVDASQLRGRVTVLFFGGVLDPQSPEELPVLQQLSERYTGRNVDVIWVSLDPEGQVTNAALAQFAKKNGFSGRVMRDPTGLVLGSLSTGRRPQLPTVVVLDAAGTLASRPVGGFDREAAFVNRLTKIIDPLL